MKIHDIIKKSKTIFWSVSTIILGGLAVFAFIFMPLEPPNRSARNARIQADISQIEKIAQEIYEGEGSYNNVNCSSEKIKPLCDDIKNISGLEPLIYASQDRYCFLARLPIVNKKGKYLCVDSTKNNYYKTSNYCDSETLTCSSQGQGPLIKAYQDYERKIVFKDIILNILKIVIIAAFIFSWVILFRKSKIIAVLIIIFLFVFLSMILSNLAGA